MLQGVPWLSGAPSNNAGAAEPDKRPAAGLCFSTFSILTAAVSPLLGFPRSSPPLADPANAIAARRSDRCASRSGSSNLW